MTQCRAWTLTVGLALALGATGGATALAAGTVTLWACHGPSGQPLGATSLTSAAHGDGSAAAYAGGCDVQDNVLSDGGVRATFTRPDPAGASTASWRLAVPAGVDLDSVTLDRATSGFGGGPQIGDPQVYTAQTSTGVLESSRLDDASDLPLTGRLTVDPASGLGVTVGVSCDLDPLSSCATPSSSGTVGVDIAALGLGVTDNSPPTGAVGGVQDPASGALALDVAASDAGLGLSTATAMLDGAQVASIALGPSSCADLSSSDPEIDLPYAAGCPAGVTDAHLDVSLANVVDGPHHLVVTVSDAAGNVTTLVDRQITVATPPSASPSSVSVTVGVGAGSGESGGGSGGGSGPGESGAGSPPATPASPALACTAASIVLIDVIPTSKDVHITGAARPALAGQTVKIQSQLNGHVVARAMIRRGGTFSAIVPLPAKKLRTSDRARYRAVVGSKASAYLKLTRRMYMTETKRVGHNVHLAGHVTGRFKAGTRVRVTQRVSCQKTRTVGTATLHRNGTWAASVPAPTVAASAVSVYRARTSVITGHRSFLTYTRPHPAS